MLHFSDSYSARGKLQCSNCYSVKEATMTRPLSLSILLGYNNSATQPLHPAQCQAGLLLPQPLTCATPIKQSTQQKALGQRPDHVKYTVQSLSTLVSYHLSAASLQTVSCSYGHLHGPPPPWLYKTLRR